MTERIKLTEDDIYWSEEYHHLTILCDLKDYEQLKQQILDDQEKAEKLDSYHYEKQVAKLQDEIKQLKDDNEFWLNLNQKSGNEIERVAVNLLERVNKKNEQINNLKQKLEKIKKYLDSQNVPDYGFPWHNDITKILEE